MMTEREYDAIQYDLSKLLKKVRRGYSRAYGKREEAYEEGYWHARALFQDITLIRNIERHVRGRNSWRRIPGFQLQRDFRKMVKRSLFGMNTSDMVTTIVCIRPMG